MFIIETIIFIFGLIFGSFFNVVAIRTLRGESIIYPPSNCTHCQYRIKWYENIPVISYIFLLGKCSKCKNKISLKYPFFELLTGLIFVLTYLEFGFNLKALLVLLIMSLLVVITITDIEERLIPNKILIWFGIPIFILSIFAPLTNMTSRMIGFIGILIFFVLLLLITSGKGIGGGDVKLFLLLSLIFGAKNILIIFYISIVIGFVYGLFFLIKRKREIPFAPAIFLSVFIFLYLEDKITKIISNLF